MTLDDIFKVLAKKIDLKTGEDLMMKSQINDCIAKQQETQLKGIKNQLLVQNCMDMRSNLNKDVYRGLMQCIAKSYEPDNSTIMQEDGALSKMIDQPYMDELKQKE